eukprot:Hpha_TRINITY_DN16771_c1_g6::TRINITY_DN16771_c1_g6_i1::g.75988::m.75988
MAAPPIGGRYGVAAEHIDAYQEYHLLVGEADGGRALPQKDFDALRARAQSIIRSGKRLFVYWRNLETGEDCYCVGPSSRCFCGHSYSTHAWFETETKKPQCRAPGCKCNCFNYINGRGSQFIRCECKHEHTDHRAKNGLPASCARPGCRCQRFHSSWRCGSCNQPWAAHATVVESQAEREARGLETANLGASVSAVGAAAGGITRYASLLPGCERGAAEALPFTDRGTVAGPGMRAVGYHAGRSGGAMAPPVSGSSRALLALDTAHDAAAARRAAGQPQQRLPPPSGGRRLGSVPTPPSPAAARPGDRRRSGPAGAAIKSSPTGAASKPGPSKPSPVAAVGKAAAATPAARVKPTPKRGPALGRRSRQPTRAEMRDRAASAAEQRIARATAEKDSNP